jgi:peptide/nickel transport system substrate-binding protein
VVPNNNSTNLLLNRTKPPFDNADIRRAVMLALDRKAFIQILGEGQGDASGAMQPPPEGVWGLPPDQLAALPGYGPDIEKNRADARALMEKAGYGADKHLALKVSTRNIPLYRDAAVILIDQLKNIWIDGELEPIETANWFPKIARKDYQVGLNITGNAVDDPDQQFFENFACGSERNYSDYCNADLDKKFVEQSEIADPDKRRQLVWDIDKQLQLDAARPIIMFNRTATCWQKDVKNETLMVNSIFNGWRFEDLWLDR